MTQNDLRKNLDSESGRLHWQELEKHFARGAVRVISNETNLIDIAVDIAQNNTEKISIAVENNTVSEPTDSQARDWQQQNASYLCVVVAPFVLIQESKT